MISGQKKRSGILFTLGAAFFVLLFSAALFDSCYTSQPSVSRQNFSKYYKPEEKVLRPGYVLFNVTDSMSRLYFTVNSTDLLYSKNGGSDDYTARVLLSYVMHPVDLPKMVADSGHSVMTDVSPPGENKQLASWVDIDVPAKGKYFLEITFRDMNKLTISYELLYLDQSGPDSPNDFLLVSKETDSPLFRNYVDPGESFMIRCKNSYQGKLFVRRYGNSPYPAHPPYSTYKYQDDAVPDSSWWMSDSAHTSLSLSRKGWYLFSTGENSTGGIVVARFSPGFPVISDPRDLLYPLRYHTTKEEYTKMDTASDTKKEVDQFWLDKSGSEERAREVIRNFYNRVEAADKLFSTEKEGWKSDRGMIYIIYGPPQNVYRNVSSETWIYGNDFGPGSVSFVFDHVANAPTDQEFELARSQDYRVSWTQEVDEWRQGHVTTMH
ncbi:MAG TPA: GWxTD domain-containing protein [Bacteroidia bacterium]|nr:GWxTD domain-containing protein [Bacteroidia bacterium]